LAQREQDVRVELRTFDADVLDAERALAVPGEDDVADVLARTEALRERSRGLVNLVTERGRGLDRELASVADEGVVESLVAEAALEPRARDAQVAQVAAERARSEMEAQIGVSPDLTVEARELRGAEEALRDADATLRQAESDATRWRARAEMLALALEEAHA